MLIQNEIIKAHEDLEQLNNEIIQKQKEQIKLLEEHIIELREIIEKYLLKDVKL
jgi:glycerol-3-phosphate responsive antiterminator